MLLKVIEIWPGLITEADPEVLQGGSYLYYTTLVHGGEGGMASNSRPSSMSLCIKEQVKGEVAAHFTHPPGSTLL